MPVAPAARIVVVDNEPDHLDGLMNALQRLDLSCRPLYYPQDLDGARPSPHVRVLFTDLKLVEGDMSLDPAACYGAIGGLIQDTVRPKGPYIVVLWTRHDGHAPELLTYLNDNLPVDMCPLAVAPLAKEKYLIAGTVTDAQELVRAINEVVVREPQVAALLAWEAHVMDAAGHTIAEIGRLARLVKDSDLAGGIAVLLAKMAEASVGKVNVGRDRFGAVNRALVPVLADRVGTSAAQGKDDTASEEAWHAAFDERDVETKLKDRVAAALNCASSIAPGEKQAGDGRGAVVLLSDLPSGEQYWNNFGLSDTATVEKQFGCKGYNGQNEEMCKRVLVQAQAACDHAQGQPGPLPFYLGLDLPTSRIRKRGKPPMACWTSPRFTSSNDGEIRVLRVNARFGMFLSRDLVRSNESVYRLREQLINELIYHIHSYGSRPGVISFR